jgi:alpha-tubulin suppressor-like RCC1 family protein
VNCGGPACEPCAEGAGCALDVDCQSQICTADVTAKCPNGQPCCQVPACGNGFKSAGETDVDCGGSVCDRCALGKACLYSSDCESSYCYQGTCTALRLAAGGKHTCALTSTGAVRCWGDGSVGQLGYGNTMGKGASPGQMPPPNVDVGSSPLVQITAGGAHTCGVTADGQLKCWGDGKFGALGYGNTTLLIVGDDEAPGASNVGYVGLGAGTTVAQVSAGGGQTCVRNVSGALGVWGNFCDVSSPFPCNSTSYFGDNEPALTLFDGQLLEMATGVHAAQIALGAFHGCAITRGGAIRCWGHMGGGQLGFGDTQPRMPFIVEGSEPFVDLGRGVIAVQIAAGGAHTCVLIRSAAVKCWGSSEQGQLGLGHTATIGDGTVPMPPPDVDLGVGFSTIQLAAGDEHTCALSQDGDVRCWGSGLHGQLGYGNTHNIGDEPSEMPPQNVDLGANIKAAQLVAGAQHTCVLTTAGSVKCWGQGTYGQLGYGNTNAIGASVTPATVGFVAVE